jgi:type II secretory pathway pseudopilin PulG
LVSLKKKNLEFQKMKTKIQISNFKTLDSQAGFSLLELLIYLVLLALMSLVVASVFITIIQGQGQIEVRSDVNSNLRFATEKIVQDIRAASAVGTPSGAGGTSNTLVMTVSGSTITYCVASNQLRRLVGAGTCDATTEPITSDSVIVTIPTCPTTCIFTRLENTNSVLSATTISIKVSLTITSLDTVGAKQFSSSKTTTVSLKY